MIAKRHLVPALALVCLLRAGAGAGAARAGVDVDFGASIQLGDDPALFLAISSRCFDRDPEVVRMCRARFRDPDDCAVALFLVARSGRDPDFIFRMRSDGVPWWEIGARIGVPEDAWFVPVTHTPGPPYGRAYGHWRRHGHDPRYRFRLTDGEARDLVALRMLNDYYGVRPRVAMEWRAQHRSVQSLMLREYRSRHPLRGADENRGRPERRDRSKRGDRDDRGEGRGKHGDKSRGRGGER